MSRRRFLPRNGPAVRWPARARRVGHLCLAVLAVVWVLSVLLARFSPERYLRLVQLYRSLPVVVIVIALVSGLIWLLLDTVRSVLSAVLTPPDPDAARRRLLDGSVLLWLLSSVVAAVLLLIPAVTDTFGIL